MLKRQMYARSRSERAANARWGNELSVVDWTIAKIAGDECPGERLSEFVMQMSQIVVTGFDS